MPQLNDTQLPSWFSMRGIVLLAFCIAFAFQGSRGLYEPTEGRYVRCAAEMLTGGDFLVPTLDHQPHWTKPPLTYWSSALGMAAFGLNDWGARFYLAVAFGLTVLVVGQTARLMWDESVAKVAALVSATLLLPIAGANSVSADMLVTLFTALALYGFWLALARGSTSGLLWMWGALGAGFLTKGPPALMPLAGILPTLWLIRRRGHSITNPFNPNGLLLFLLIGGGWYAYSIATHPGLLHYWLADEVVARVASEKFKRNSEWHKPFTMYLPVLLIGTQPWLTIVGWHWKRLVPQGVRQILLGDRTESPAWFFLRFSILIPLLIFSLAQSRLWLYLLPLSVPIALLLGKGIHQLIEMRILSMPTVSRLALGVAGVAILLKGIMAFAIPNDRDMKVFSRMVLACTAPSEQNDYILVNNSDTRFYYGLEFYLNTSFYRVDLSAEGDDEQALVTHYLMQWLQIQSSDMKTVIITRKKYRDLLERTIQELGFHPVIVPTHEISRLSQYFDPAAGLEVVPDLSADERKILCFLMP